MPSPSAIWVCDRPSCWRMRRKRGPTNSFFPVSPDTLTSLTCFVTKLTKLHFSLKCMLHRITNQNQGIYTYLRVSRLPHSTHFATRCHVCGDKDGENIRAAGSERAQ